MADKPAYVRFITKMFGDKFALKQSHCDKIAENFERNGGSWYRLFHLGSDVDILKKTAKEMAEDGLLEKRDE